LGTSLALAAALVAGQAIPLALAPSFEVQLRLVADRASMHLIPALLLVVFGVVRFSPRAP
jgi:hypothetical protein